MDSNLAEVKDIEAAWRPLNDTERSRAEYWISSATRRIRRNWPNVDARIQSGEIDRDDVSDVIISLVIDILPGLEHVGAKSWSVQAGSESKAVTLEQRRNEDRLHFEDWMVAIFEKKKTTTAQPRIAAPRPYDLNRVFPTWMEVYDE